MYDNVEFDSSYSAAPKEIHPKGIFKATTVDIVDLPQQKNNFYDPNKKGSKPFIDQVKLVWETAAKRSDGKPFRISKTFSKSLYDGSAGGAASSLHLALDSWLGGEYTGRFESRKLAGRPAMLVIVHETKGDKTKAKIRTIMPDESGEPYVADGTYKRWIPKDDQKVTAIEDAFNEETPF